MARRRQHRNWREEFKDLFAMHKGERSAFVIVLALCLVAAAWVTWEQWIRPPMLADREAIRVVWASMRDSTGRAEDRRQQPEDEVRLFRFDPNGLPTDQWLLLGLSERQAASIHRYESRGGRFRTKADLARMRVIDPDLFARWEPYILLPDQLPSGKAPHEAKPGKWPDDSSGTRRPWPDNRGATSLVELNKADSTALVAVRGIGPAFARSILRYRDRLGGYTSLNQLQEVPILRNKPDAVFELKSRLTVDPSLARTFNLNTCTVEELGPHPYMGWKVARALLAYRDQHGPFRTVDEISGCVLVTDSIRLRMAAYLTIDE